MAGHRNAGAAPVDAVSSATRLDIGCGRFKKAGCLGIDLAAGEGIDLVLDVTRERLPFADDTVEYVYSSHCLEHLPDPHLVLSEILRVCAHRAQFELWLPYLKSNDAFVFDHRMFYNELIVTRIAYTAPDFWFRQTPGVMRLQRVVYIVSEAVEQSLATVGIPLPFALKHMFNIAREFGLFFEIEKHRPPPPRGEYAMSLPRPILEVGSTREGPARPLVVPPDYWEIR